MKAGKYRGCEVFRKPYGVEVHIHIESKGGEVRPEILLFTDASFEDFRYCIADRSEGFGQVRRTMWQRRPHQKQTA